MFRSKKALFSEEDEAEHKDEAFIAALPKWIGPTIYTKEDEEEDMLNFEKTIENFERYEEERYDALEENLVNNALEDIFVQTNDEKYWKSVDDNEQFPRLMAKNR